ncbi:MAG TPA: hypothetical protein ENH46_07060 [Candidatus Pacearchaeota archaeon]|nr:hypothetical protein [Candidatus Pacearchaeota archaeon]
MKYKTCDTCFDGTGTCKSCNGEGKVDNKECEDCEGDGMCVDCSGSGEREDYDAVEKKEEKSDDSVDEEEESEEE